MKIMETQMNDLTQEMKEISESVRDIVTELELLNKNISELTRMVRLK